MYILLTFLSGGRLDLRCVFLQERDGKDVLRPVVLEEITHSHHRQIRDLIAREKCYPEDHAQFYDKYANLVRGEVRLPLG